MIAFLESSRYVLFFVGAVFEGPVMMLAGGILLRLGRVEFLPIYGALVAGDLVADIGWYCLGRYATRAVILKFGPILSITPDTIATVERRFNRYHGKILLISKLTMGLGFAAITLMVAGMSRVPFRNFVTINLIGGLIWTMFLLTIGYYCGNVIAGIGRTQQVVFLAVVFVAFVLGLRFVNRYLMTRDP